MFARTAQVKYTTKKSGASVSDFVSTAAMQMLIGEVSLGARIIIIIKLPFKLVAACTLSTL